LIVRCYDNNENQDNETIRFYLGGAVIANQTCASGYVQEGSYSNGTIRCVEVIFEETDPIWTENLTSFEDCPEGTAMYGIYANGTIKCRTVSTSGAETTTCPEEIFGYFNPKLPSIKQTGCNTRQW
jgi:hypothetical protein